MVDMVDMVDMMVMVDRVLDQKKIITEFFFDRIFMCITFFDL